MREVILDRGQVRGTEQQRVEESPGVHRALLWEQDGSNAGLLWVDPDRHMEEHTHEQHAHHIWVVEGTAHVLGRELGAGSYAFVPPGRPHALAGGTTGCKLFYLYLET